MIRGEAAVITTPASLLAMATSHGLSPPPLVVGGGSVAAAATSSADDDEEDEAVAVEEDGDTDLDDDDMLVEDGPVEVVDERAAGFARTFIALHTTSRAGRVRTAAAVIDA